MLHRTDDHHEGIFVLGVDLDGVCANYSDAFKLIIAKEKGIDPDTLGEQTHWGFPESGWPVDDEEDYRRLHRIAVQDYRMFATLPVIEGASDALWRLSDAGVHIRIISHRLYVSWGHKVVASDTVDWLQQPRESDGRPLIPYRDLCLMADKTAVGADLYIEDSPSNVERLRQARADVICFDRPYNRHVRGLRGRGWPDVERIVLERVRDRGMGPQEDRD